MAKKKQRKYNIGTSYFVPFWVILNYLDPNPPDPFIKVKLLDVTKSKVIDTQRAMYMTTLVDTCTIEIAPGIIAEELPLDYLIHRSELDVWKTRLSNWFLNFSTKEKVK